MANIYTKDNFKEEVLGADVPVMVDFWASWCGPCKMLGPVIEEISEEAEGFKVGKVNVDEQPELATEYGIMTIPTVIIFKDGKPVKTASGVRPKKALLDMLK